MYPMFSKSLLTLTVFLAATSLVFAQQYDPTAAPSSPGTRGNSSLTEIAATTGSIQRPQQQDETTQQKDNSQSGGYGESNLLTPHYPGLPPTGPKLEATIGPAKIRFYGTLLLNFSTSDAIVVGQDLPLWPLPGSSTVTFPDGTTSRTKAKFTHVNSCGRGEIQHRPMTRTGTTQVLNERKTIWGDAIPCKM